MKPPSSPSRFQTTTRHYHRHQADDPGAWDNWVGKKGSRGGARARKIIGIFIAVLAFAGVVAFMAYEMQGGH